MGSTSRLAARQRAVLAVLRNHTAQPGAPSASWREAGLAPDAGGCHAYQRHAWAQASRALAQAYPTLLAMLGPAAMAMLARRLWQQQPPSGGDLGAWGDGLPDQIAHTPELTAWPWLADSGRLDWACHLCERAEDAVAEPDSLRHLQDAPAEAWRLELMPDLQLLGSVWPVVALRDAHATDDEDQRAAAAAQALHSAPAGAVAVWRRGGRAHCQTIPETWAGWMLCLLDSMDGTNGRRSMADCLDHAPADFDFTNWLVAALRHGWFRRVRPVSTAL